MLHSAVSASACSACASRGSSFDSRGELCDRSRRGRLPAGVPTIGGRDEEVLMRSRWPALGLALALVVVVFGVSGSALGGAGDVRVTNDVTASSYTRYDGSSDATTTACSTGRRSQNELS